MTWVWIGIAAVLLLGPLRRPFWRHRRFTVPALVGGVAAYAFTAAGGTGQVPPWGPLVVGVLGGIGAGFAVKEVLDERFGKER